MRDERVSEETGLPPTHCMMRSVRVVAHDPSWSAAYEVEAARIRGALPGQAVRVHHIGSTAVPGLAAKPVIDLLLEVPEISALDEQTAALEALGYVAMGEFGIAGRRFFRKDDRHGTRTHHVHAFARDSGELSRHLAFRDYLTAHPVVAREYEELKQRLARAHPDDIESYMEGKDAFIKEHEARALEWRG